MEDPLVKIFINNSYLTKIQLETFLIDILTENMSDKKLGSLEKAKVRYTKTNISRGAFTRTLKQAKRNVINAIYTVLLLGYLKILDTPKLSSYLEVSNKLEEYMDSYNKVWEEFKLRPIDENKVNTVISMRKELESSLSKLLSLKYNV